MRADAIPAASDQGIGRAVPVPVILVDAADGTVRWANPAAGSHLGRAPAELMGGSMLEVLQPEDRAVCAPLWAGRATDALAGRSRWRLVGRDGSAPVAHLGPIVDFQGGKARLLWMIPRLEDEPPGAKLAPLELADFAFSAFHDLKEPIHLVEGYSRLMQAHPGLDAETQEHLATVLANAERMQAFILDILEYFRARSRASNAEPVDLREPFEAALEALRLRVRESGAAITFGPLPTVVADRGQMRRLLLNLLSNAIKFHGPEPPVVQVHAAQTAEGWQITVRDHGIGVPPAERLRVFEPFHRLHSVDAFQGSGLGLSTCKAIVEAHGGRIWIGDESPGTAVHFVLPGGA